MIERLYVISGGTMVHVRPHFSLCAPAYGTVGDRIAETLVFPLQAVDIEVIPLFTRMAEAKWNDWPNSTREKAYEVLMDAGLTRLETNDDLKILIDHLVAQPLTRGIVLAAAVCDWAPAAFFSNNPAGFGPPKSTDFGKGQPRLHTRDGDDWVALEMTMTPAEKLVGRIRAGEKGNKSVFLVSFKATAGLTKEETYAAGLKALKGSSSNLVFANDVQNGHNVVVTPEEFPYYGDTRDDALGTLCEMIEQRLQLDFVRTKVIDGDRAYLKPLHESGSIPSNFLPVLEHLLAAGAYKVLPWKDSTSGHFGCVVDGQEFKRVSSVRKANHNLVLEEGVIPIMEDDGDSIIARGAKPSVGEHTQRMIYEELAKADIPGVRDPSAHSIVHFHSPMKPKSEWQFSIAQRPQKPYECGSVQCGLNTALGMGMGDTGIWAVHLEGHGPNIAFHRDVPAERVIEFIERHWELSAKSGGIVAVKENG
jgi:hypothetical protein